MPFGTSLYAFCHIFIGVAIVSLCDLAAKRHRKPGAASTLRIYSALLGIIILMKLPCHT